MTEDKEEKNCYTSRYKALFTNAEDMILFFDADGFVCEKNDAVCKNLGCTMDDKIYMQDIFLSYRFSFGIILPILLPVTIFIILRVWSNCFSKRFTS